MSCFHDTGMTFCTEMRIYAPPAKRLICTGVPRRDMRFWTGFQDVNAERRVNQHAGMPNRSRPDYFEFESIGWILRWNLSVRCCFVTENDATINSYFFAFQ